MYDFLKIEMPDIVFAHWLFNQQEVRGILGPPQTFNKAWGFNKYDTQLGKSGRSNKVACRSSQHMRKLPVEL